MAVVYWSYEQFVGRLFHRAAYIIKHNDNFYLLDRYMIINLSTLEICTNQFIDTRLMMKRAYLSNDIRLKQIFDSCEIIDEKDVVQDSYLLKHQAIDLYLECKKSKMEYGFSILLPNVEKTNKIERRTNLIGKQINLDQFKQNGLATPNEDNQFIIPPKNFKIRYNNKIYLFKCGVFSCECGEIYPNKKINKVTNFDDLFTTPIIDGKNLCEVWDNCEIIDDFIYGFKQGCINFGTYSEYWGVKPEIVDLLERKANQNKKELIRLYRIAEDDMIAQGHIPQSSLSFKRIIWLWFKYKAPWVKKRKEKSKCL